ncbi:MAG: hypothetical protein II295_09085 [Akkermansia sp.]|nr:hypothetical protein [Akkermansia sp.]
MVKGLQVFRDYFQKDIDNYILIGGSACDVHFEQVGLNFRATQDLDIVLCVESITSDFVARFWDFIRSGGYTIRQRSDGRREFYRFVNPRVVGFPRMLELFARRPDMLPLVPDIHLTPIPAEAEVSSLSAILLDTDYYNFILSQRQVVDGVSVVSPEGLVVLKARAWMDLKARSAAGLPVDSRHIRKHRNDIIDLLPNIRPVPLSLPDSVRRDMASFLQDYATESVDLKARLVPRGMSFSQLLDLMKILYAGVGDV